MPDNKKKSHKRILLGHLGRRGDCLYATTIARQIKNDFPDCHLTWAISSMCRSVIEGNPYIDEIWELPLKTNEEIVAAWKQFEIDVINRKKQGEYDEVYLTQVHPGNMQNYDGTSRASIFRGYPRPITVPIQPVVRLSNKEIDNVSRFANLHQLSIKKHIVLFECASTSGQSFVTPEFAINVAQNVLMKYPDACFILTSDISINTSDYRIIDGSVLSFKENAELTKYCSLLVGCSSGISWLSTSDWAKPLPKIQILNADTVMYASMVHDAEYFRFPTDQILEMQDCTLECVASCIKMVFDHGFTDAKKEFHQAIPVNFSFYFRQLYWELLRKNEFGKAAMSLSVTMHRHENHPQIINLLLNILFPYLDIIWTIIPKTEQEYIINRLNYIPKKEGYVVVFKRIMSYLKLFKSILNKDTRPIVVELIKLTYRVH